MLSYILLDIIVCYLKLLDFIYVISQTMGHYCTLSHKIMGAIVCYLTNYWMSLLQTTGHYCMLSHTQLDVIVVTSQTVGCLILSHELLNVIVGYLTNY
jgi:hypothetical protein